MTYRKTTITAAEILAAINAGLAAKGDDTDWDAPEFAEAVRLTGEAGCVWDFDGWRQTRTTIESHGRLGGVRLAGVIDSDANHEATTYLVAHIPNNQQISIDQPDYMRGPCFGDPNPPKCMSCGREVDTSRYLQTGDMLCCRCHNLQRDWGGSNLRSPTRNF